MPECNGPNPLIYAAGHLSPSPSSSRHLFAYSSPRNDRFPVLEHSPDALPRRTTIGAWIDLQLCSVPRKRQEKAEQQGSTGDNPLGPLIAERASVDGAATVSTRKAGASFAGRDATMLEEEEAEDLVPERSITPFVLVDVEGTQSRDRGGAEGVEFDSR